MMGHPTAQQAEQGRRSEHQKKSQLVLCSQVEKIILEVCAIGKSKLHKRNITLSHTPKTWEKENLLYLFPLMDMSPSQYEFPVASPWYAMSPVAGARGLPGSLQRSLRQSLFGTAKVRRSPYGLRKFAACRSLVFVRAVRPLSPAPSLIDTTTAHTLSTNSTEYGQLRRAHSKICAGYAPTRRLS